MRQKHAEDIYAYFQQFVEKFILEGSSILTDHEAILDITTLQNCFTNYVDNFKEGKQSFGQKVRDQFKEADINTRLVFAHAEWLWAFAVNDIGVWRKKELTKRTTEIQDDSQLKNVYPEGFGSAGMYHKNNKYEEIKFILFIIQFLKRKREEGMISNPEQVYQWIEKICLFQKYNIELPEFPIPDDFKTKVPEQKLAVSNILCYVCYPDRYERIASDSHKWQIRSSFSGLLSEEERDVEAVNTDEAILLIRTRLGEITGNTSFDFYDDEYQKVWNYSLTQEGFSEVQGLQYKKAIVLYGPPGTSKTHTAKNLANALISSAYLSNKENVVKYFKGTEDFTKGRIHRLQLHANYNYEDFVAGVQLINHETRPVKGKLFSICEAAEKDQKAKMPHVLILDEINRVDLSRLFGEVFSALENRGEEIEVGVGNFKLTIPDNLYVIGTMNEIDFSLERVDFALRRRFLWFLYGFDSSTLRNIIKHKNAHLRTRLEDEEIDAFISRSEALNKTIAQLPELGEQYQIGHTFFAEVVEIYASYKELKGYTNRIKNKIYRQDGAAKILWDISIEPILSAFLGNMDSEVKQENLKAFSKVYFNG